MSKPNRRIRVSVEIEGENVGKLEDYIDQHEGKGGYDEYGNYRDYSWYFNKIITETLDDYEDTAEGYDE